MTDEQYEEGLGVETPHGLVVPGEQADRRVGERESEGVRLLAMDMSVGARVVLQMAQPFQRRPVNRRQSLPLNQSSRWVRSLAASCSATDVTCKS
ncbi:hypothetical protein ACQEVF_45890 [Nonomuraea polychroma]|uniref:hypothetical protein n=1 Tax=Nonomuraea polychroma TaxID=46176 RepID=UPI003D90F888